MRTQSTECRPFQRDLAGGGYVAIEVRPAKWFWRASRYEGMLIAERRASARQETTSPPVIARVSGKTVEDVVRQLLPAAQSDAAIGSALLHLRRPA